MAVNRQKLKLLYLMQMLLEETDVEHGLSMPDIIARLGEQGVGAERKSLYRDIESLREFGLDIRVYHRAPAEYAIATRDFDLSELALMVNAVQSLRFLSERKAKSLVNSIKGLASSPQRAALDRQIHVEGRVRLQSESVFFAVDCIHQAIAGKRQLCFVYCDYDVNKNRVPRKDERIYQETPVRLICSEGNYYLAAYNEKHARIVIYRVDRMAKVRVSDHPASRNEVIANFDVTKYENRSFSMFGGKAVPVTMTVAKEAMNAVIDRFGRDVHVVAIDVDRARVSAVVMISPTLYGWLAQFGSQIQVEQPRELVEGYREHLQNILETLK
ncbi:MAG: WYL domain-containing protein [Gordonibacter sp.]